MSECLGVIPWEKAYLKQIVNIIITYLKEINLTKANQN